MSAESKIITTDTEEMAEICATLTKQGVQYVARRNSDKTWTIELTGGF